MNVLRTVLIILHFVGLASLLGGFLYQVKEPVKRVLQGMVHGALTQVVTGVALVGVAYGLGNGDKVDNTKIAVKLIVAVVITVLVFMGRRKESITTPVWAAIGALTLLNVVIAVAWR